MINKQPFAEVIHSSLTGWTGQSWEWNIFPTFGSLLSITANKKTWIGIVHHIQTGSPDTHRQPFIYKKTEKELLQEQPHIFEFLQTTFECATIGFFQDNHIEYRFAPTPPKIHSFIQPCSESINKEFFASTAYLPLLFSHTALTTHFEELCIAILAGQKQKGLLSEITIYEFLETLALLYGNDYRKLKIFSQRLLSLSLHA